MAKTRAYKTQYGVGLDEMVTAKEVERRRIRDFNGQPTGESFYSTHKPGRRLPVKHVMKGGNSFFSYIEGGGGSGSDGESLNHLLFKEALLGVERVKLSLSSFDGKRVDVPIRISRVEVEKRLNIVGGGVRYVDAYIEFVTDHWLGSKWDGRVYVEIHHSHAVDAKKQEELRELDVPVIEVGVPEVFSYKVSDEDTNDSLEQQHKAWIKKVLEGKSGFLQGVVLNNPSSKVFLESVISSQQERLSGMVRERDELQQQLELSVDKLNDCSAENSRLLERVEELARLLEFKNSELVSAAGKIRQSDYEYAVILGKVKSLARINMSLTLMLFFAFICLLYLAYLSF